MKTRTAALAALCLLTLAWGVSAWAVTPYTNDANTVLLEHFEGSTTGTTYAVHSASGSCGPSYPTTSYSPSYSSGQTGLGTAIQLCHSNGLPEPTYTALRYAGELLSQANGTLEFWLRVSGYGANGYGLISQGPYFGACSGWTFGMSLSSNGVVSASAWNAFGFTSGTNAVPLNQWTHLALTWGSAGAKLYLNGQLVGTDANTGAPAGGYGGHFLGTFGTTEAGHCVQVDELRISNIQRTSFNVSNEVPHLAQGWWMSGASLSVPRADAAAGALGSQLVLASGATHMGPTTQTEAYRPPYFAWANKAATGLARTNAAAAALGEKLYVFGGATAGSITNVVEVYSASANTWTRLGAMPIPRAKACAAALGNRIYVIGGITNGGAAASSALVEFYDPATANWSSKAPLPTARDNAMAAAIGGKLYVVGGHLGAGQRTAVLEVYDPVTDSWSPKASMPTARERAAIGVINGLLHVVGGQGNSGALQVHEVYDPATDSWSTRPARLLATTRLPSGQHNVGAILVVPGGDNSSQVETYAPGLSGPTYPPPGDCTFNQSGSPGRSGGLTWTLGGLALATNTFAYWGATNNGVRLSFNSSAYGSAGEVMTYQPSQSDLNSNLLVWTGQTYIPGGATVYTRCLVSITTGTGVPSLTTATNVCLPGNVGALYRWYPGATMYANIKFEAAYSASGPFSPALDLYDAAHKPGGSGNAHSSFAGGFYYVNQPPSIGALSNLVVQVNTNTGPLAFTVADWETNAAVLGVRALSGNTNLVPLSGIALGGSGSTRTVTVTPASNQTGSATITLVVTNGPERVDTTFWLRVNSPPRLTANNELTVDAGSNAVISSSLLAVSDADHGPEALVYTVNPDGSGGPPRAGVLQLNGANLVSGATFTQADINEGRLVYVNTNRCTSGDDFQFGVRDADGGILQDGNYRVFSFRMLITPVHLPFGANNQNVAVGLGGTVAGQLTVANSNCPPLVLNYRLVANGTKGTALVSANGAFSYTAAAGQVGTDSFTFQCHDGTSDAVAPGTVHVSIEQLPPVALAGTATVLQDSQCSGQLSASNPNIPPPPVQYLLAGNGTNGTVTIDPSTGLYTYRPASGQFGTDAFSFQVTDGLSTSQVAVVTVTIRPTLEPNDILVADTRAKAVILVRLPSGAQFPLATNGWLAGPRHLAVEPTGKIIVLDQGSGLVRVDPTTGSQTQLTSAASFSTDPIGPTSLAIETNGTILVADGVNGLVRVNPLSGTVSTCATGGWLSLCQGVTVAPDNTIYAGSANAFVGSESAVVRIDSATGSQTLVTNGAPLLLPVGMTLAHGVVYLTDVSGFASAPPDKLLGIDLGTGEPSVVSTDAALTMPTGLARATNGNLFVSSLASASILEVTTNGVIQPAASGGWLQEPFGLAVVRAFPQVTSVGRTSGGALRLLLTGEPGHWVAVEASTNLVNWAPLVTLPNPTGTVQYDDAEATVLPRRFYRLRRY